MCGGSCSVGKLPTVPGERVLWAAAFPRGFVLVFSSLPVFCVHQAGSRPHEGQVPPTRLSHCAVTCSSCVFFLPDSLLFPSSHLHPGGRWVWRAGVNSSRGAIGIFPKPWCLRPLLWSAISSKLHKKGTLPPPPQILLLSVALVTKTPGILDKGAKEFSYPGRIPVGMAKRNSSSRTIYELGRGGCALTLSKELKIKVSLQEGCYRMHIKTFI